MKIIFRYRLPWKTFEAQWFRLDGETARFNSACGRLLAAAWRQCDGFARCGEGSSEDRSCRAASITHPLVST
jgi:hypothetical protein